MRVSFTHVEIWTLLTTIVASSMANIDSFALRTALPSLQANLNINASELLWVENSYTLMLSALILVSGALGDLYGRKRVFAIGIVVFSVASVLCGIAPTVGVLIAARVLQGIGGALLIPASLAIISAVIDPKRRGTAVGIWSMTSTLMVLVGPVLGGWLAEQGLWRSIFFLNIPLAVIALWLLLVQVPETKRHDAPPLDWLGAVLVTLGLAGLTYGLTEVGAQGFGSLQILAALGVGVGGIGGFLWVEWRSSHPLMPFSLFGSRAFSSVNALTFFLYGPLSAVPLFLLLNLVQVQGYENTFAGFVMLPIGIMITVLSPFAGRLIKAFGERLLLIVGPALVGLGFVLLAWPDLSAGQAGYWLTVFPAMLLVGLGMGITVAPLSTVMLNAAPTELAGTASGVNNAISRIAGVLTVVIFGALALGLFRANVSAQVAILDVSSESVDIIIAQTQNLAAAQPPAELAETLQSTVQNIYSDAFLQTYRVLMILGAVLAWLGAAMSLGLPPRTLKE
jgi:EmrB/QacA subfamily drug resistance transporter